VLEVGQIISGKYKLLRHLGGGGMGSVYEAEHLGLGTHVAMKFLHDEVGRRPGVIDRFLQEARVSAQIRSPHVVSVTDVDRTPDGIAYLVMELLEGEPLSSVIRRAGQLERATACEYTLQILQALEAAHAIGVIHRDLKPDNVLVTFHGDRPVLKLIDFGIAKLKPRENGTTKNLTVAGTLMGTAEYMAPEQAQSADKVDVTADLYAVGVMLYEMLAGTTPVRSHDPHVVVIKVERGEITPLVHAAPDTPPELAGFVHRAMAPQPALRFSSATEMRLALEALTGVRRVKTAKLAATAAKERDRQAEINVQSAPFSPVAPNSPIAPIAIAEAEGGGTGTVVATPVASAFGASAGFPGDANHVVNHVVSVNATPAQLHGPPFYESRSPFESHESRGPHARRGRGPIIVLAITALLLGAGAVVAYVLGTSTNEPPAPHTTEPTEPSAPTTATTAPATRPPATPAVPATEATPLAPGPIPVPHPATPTAPQSKPPTPNKPPTSNKPPAPYSSAPPAASSSPPFVFPSALPSSLPTAFPSAIPLPWPSAFPGFPWQHEAPSSSGRER